MSELAVRYDEEEQNKEVAQFEVTDDQKAEWCMKKIREAQSDKETWKRFYEAQYAAVEAAADATISQMESMLRRYFDSVPHKVTKTQENYSLPSGKLVIKKQEPEFQRDDDKVIDWLKANDKKGFVKVKESLDWQGLKKTVTVVGDEVATEDGEIIPGVKAIKREDIFKVEVK